MLTLRGPSGPRRGSAMRDLGLIQDGALLIADGIIRDVGPSRRVENLAAARDADEISADGRLVMPGFVDSHTQLICGPPSLDEYEMRILAKDAGDVSRSGSATDKTTQALRSASKQRLEADARKAIREFIRHGTTSIGAKAVWDPEARSEMKALRVLAALSDKPLDLFATFHVESSGLSDASAEADSTMVEIFSGILSRRLARFVGVECGEGALPPEEARRVLDAAKEHGFYVNVTASRLAPSAGVELAVELKAASADHLEFITPSDIELLAHSQTVATLIPGAVFHSRTERYPPARDLLDAGAAVALATGFSSGRCPSCSLPAILSLACNQMRMTPAEAIAAATINGAHALRCGNRLGSLEYGKEADLLMLNVSDYREIPYHFGMNMIAMCMKRGDVLYPRMSFS